MNVVPAGSDSEEKSASFLDEIKARGGAASLKKDDDSPKPTSFLDEIKAKGGAAALRKSTHSVPAHSEDTMNADVSLIE